MTWSFSGYGRDIQAAADSAGSPELGQAVKAVIQYGRDDLKFDDATWSVSIYKSTDEDGTASSIGVSFSRGTVGAYVAPVWPSAIEPAPESVASQVRAQEGYVDPEADAQPEEPKKTPKKKES